MGGRNTTSATTYDHHECRDLLSKHNASSGLSLALLVGAAISSTELRRVPVPIPVPQHSHRGCSNQGLFRLYGNPARSQKGKMGPASPKSSFPAHSKPAHPFLAPAAVTQQLALTYFAFVYSHIFYCALQVNNIKWLLTTFQ